MFDEHFPAHCASTVMRWTPTWSKQTDPSGRLVPEQDSLKFFYANTCNRAISIHQAKYESTE